MRKNGEQRQGSTSSHKFTSSFILPLAWSSDSFTVRFLQKLSCDPNKSMKWHFNLNIVHNHEVGIALYPRAMMV